MDTRSKILEDSRRKGVATSVAAAGTVTLAVVGAPVFATIAGGATALLAYRWWKHRAENGIKF